MRAASCKADSLLITCKTSSHKGAHADMLVQTVQVLRSSIREFLASEALYHLVRVATTEYDT